MKSEDVLIAACCLHAIGCYDGCLYAYHAESGCLHWMFATGGAVKSSPCTDPNTGYVWFGSHDYHLYAVSLEVIGCVAIQYEGYFSKEMYFTTASGVCRSECVLRNCIVVVVPALPLLSLMMRVVGCMVQL